ncbi:ABC transporter permease [Pseudomonadota bacterium]
MFNRYIQLWLSFAKTSLAREIEYKGNFITQIIVQLGWTMVSLVSIEIIFFNTESLVGWNKGELILIFAIYRSITALYAIFVRKNIRQLSSLVNSGEFDLLLTKPVNTLFMTCFRIVDLERLFSLLIGTFLVYYAHTISPIYWSFTTLSILIICIISGSLIRFAVSLIIHTPIMWIQKLTNLERLEIAFFGISRYPRQAFPPLVRGVFSFVFPVLFAAAAPAEILTQRSPSTFIIIILIVTFSFLLFMTRFFHFALRHYSSASS